MEDKLKEYGLKVYWNKQEGRNSNDPDDYYAIDFSIEDSEDNVAWVWGSTPDDVEVECDHPEECIEYGDDDECGECLLCGDQCLWHWEEGEEYEGTDDDGNVLSSKWGNRVIDEWHHTGNKGLIGKYLKKMAERW